MNVLVLTALAASFGLMKMEAEDNMATIESIYEAKEEWQDKKESYRIGQDTVG